MGIEEPEGPDTSGDLQASFGGENFMADLDALMRQYESAAESGQDKALEFIKKDGHVKQVLEPVETFSSNENEIVVTGNEANDPGKVKRELLELARATNTVAIVDDLTRHTPDDEGNGLTREEWQKWMEAQAEADEGADVAQAVKQAFDQNALRLATMTHIRGAATIIRQQTEGKPVHGDVNVVVEQMKELDPGDYRRMDTSQKLTVMKQMKGGANRILRAFGVPSKRKE